MPLSSKLVDEYLKKLQDIFPLGYPLRIRILPQVYDKREEVHGRSWQASNGTCWIELTRYPESVMVDYLYHEYAHLYADVIEGEHDDNEPHGDAYWIQFGEMYRLCK